MKKHLPVAMLIGLGIVSTLAPAAAGAPNNHSSATENSPLGHLSSPTGSTLSSHAAAQQALPALENVSQGTDASILKGLGTGAGDHSSITVNGNLTPPFTFVRIPAGREDNGSIRTATPTGVGETANAVTSSGVIGDGPHAAKGDFDFYRVDARARQTISVKVRTQSGSLDSAVTLYDACGHAVATADDSPGTTDTTLIQPVRTSGAYYVMVAASGAQPVDPFDSASGTGATSEGPYTLGISAGTVAAHDYTVRLRKGDVIGAAVTGVPDKVTIYDPDGTQDEGSTGNVAHNHPADSPLPSGKVSADTVAAREGVYRIRVSGDVPGTYRLNVLTSRPNLEGTGRTQTIYLNFNGAQLDPSIFASAGLPPIKPGVRTTSPLSSFLSAWGLPASEEVPLSDAITADVLRSVETDVAASHMNNRYAVRILNSEHDPEPADRSDVDHVIVGGTIPETGLPTLGVSTSIDPGNFDTQDTSIVMLDVLSGATNEPSSLNHYMSRRSDKIAYIARAVANLISHEIGHTLGSWHTASGDAVSTLMDNDSSFMDPGPDGVGGTSDDPAPQAFDVDTFSTVEGLSGTENTLARSAFGLSH